MQGHSPEQRAPIPGKRNVAILKIEPVGNYAVRISLTTFMIPEYSPGIYLHQLGHEKEERWNSYLAELSEKGLSARVKHTSSVILWQGTTGVFQNAPAATHLN